jgi:hypothetical protein
MLCVSALSNGIEIKWSDYILLRFIFRLRLLLLLLWCCFSFTNERGEQEQKQEDINTVFSCCYRYYPNPYHTLSAEYAQHSTFRFISLIYMVNFLSSFISSFNLIWLNLIWFDYISLEMLHCYRSCKVKLLRAEMNCSNVEWAESEAEQ